MSSASHYGTVSEAITKLRKQGFTRDFNLEENCIVCHPDKFSHDQFEVVDVYHYEGDSDPADKSSVYAIQSSTGVRGILVTGSGINMDKMTTEILQKLRMRK